MDLNKYLAHRTIEGDFVNGQERRENLGPLYARVQNEVNRQVGYSKRYYYWFKIFKYKLLKKQFIIFYIWNYLFNILLLFV